MASILDKLRARFRALEESVHRLEAVQAENTQFTQSALSEIRQTVNALQQSQTDARNEANQGISHIRGTVDNTQQLSGEALTAINAYRSDQETRGMAIANAVREAVGRIESRQIQQFAAKSASGRRRWQENEFRVYSQFGEDGLLQFLFHHLPNAPRTFVEFGVEDYKESNTRFLLLKDRSWAGLVMDGSEENVSSIRRDPAYLLHNLKVASAWISPDNINDLLRDQGFSGKIGLLSVDIDGNDFWVWKALTVVDPVVVIAEYNYRFGADPAVVVPYDPLFDKAAAHPTGIYYGASLRALTTLADQKGYALVGCSGGVNAFFVRRDCLSPEVPEVSVSEGYIEGHHAEMRDPGTGRIIKATLEEQKQLLLSLPLEYIGN